MEANSPVELSVEAFDIAAIRNAFKNQEIQFTEGTALSVLLESEREAGNVVP